MCSHTEEHGHMLQEEMDLLSKAGRDLPGSSALSSWLAALLCSHKLPHCHPGFRKPQLMAQFPLGLCSLLCPSLSKEVEKLQGL